MAAQLPLAVIYDWDNTLIDTFPLLKDVTNTIRRHFGLEEWDDVTARRNIRLPAAQAFPPIYGDRWQDAYDMHMTQMKARHLDEMTIMPGAVELVEYLKDKGVTQAIFSNKTNHLLRDEVAQLTHVPVFHAIVGTGDYKGLSKPDPAGLLAALALLGIQKDDFSKTWYVGDTENDLKTANAAGVIPIFIENHAMSDPLEIAAQTPQHSFKSCIECLAYLKSLG